MAKKRTSTKKPTKTAERDVEERPAGLVSEDESLADTERVLSPTTRTPSPPATICAGAIEATKD